MQYKNPFTEGEYPSPIAGLRRSYEAYAADTARRKAEQGNQRQQMMQWFVEQMLARQEEAGRREYEQTQEQEQRRYDETQEAKQREYEEGRTATKRQRDYDTWVKKYGTPEQQQQWKIDLAKERGTQARRTHAARPKAGEREPKDLSQMDYDRLIRLSNDNRNSPEVYADIMDELRDRGYDVPIPQVSFEVAYSEALQMVKADANSGLVRSVIKQLGWNPELNAFKSLFPTGRTGKRMMER